MTIHSISAAVIGKLEHTSGKPKFTHKSARIRLPDFALGQFFMNQLRGIRFVGSRGRWGPKSWISGSASLFSYIIPRLYIEVESLLRACTGSPCYGS